MSFDVIVLAVGPAARSHKVCGLTLAERGRRLANKAGATRVHLVDSIERAQQLPGWVADRDVLVLRASDQVVHFPLVDAVKGGGARIAVGPDGVYAGAIWVPRTDAPQVAAALATDPEHGDIALAKQWRESQHATEHVHGEIARHRAVTADERKAATRMLFQLIYKSQDGPLTKFWFRPIAYPITRAFLPTPLTPNHVTAIACVLAMTGCAMVAFPSYLAAVIGSLLQHVASYFDCTDGEIARLRHEGSKAGQWFDTLTDEATTVLYLAGIGIHVYHRQPDWQPYLQSAIPFGVACSLASNPLIYFYHIKVARSGKTQDKPVSPNYKIKTIALTFGTGVMTGRKSRRLVKKKQTGVPTGLHVRMLAIFEFEQTDDPA
ncbi:MAG: CDP-alcohol phosphatidyltransferase family protein, partial [Kofleriaceae bacterium]